MELIRTKNKEQRTKNKKNDSPGFLEETHGGNIYKAARELGMPESGIIDFSASINPLGVSERVKEVIKKDLDNIVHYPDPDTEALRYIIAEYHDIYPETIICGNGSTELIYLIPRALKPERALIPVPTFSEYEKAIREQNMEHRTQIKYLSLKKEDKFKVDPDEFIAAMTGTLSNLSEEQINSLHITRHASRPFDMAFLCNPNNPTGGFLTKNEVEKIAQAAQDMKCILVVDEAFIDFIPEESVIRKVRNNPYLIVFRSLTKFYALTGLRIGYGVFHENVIERIKTYKEPWTVNSLAQKSAIAALSDREYVKETMELMQREKDFLENAFKDLGIEFISSAVNFYLLKINQATAISRELKQMGILIRDCSNFKGLDDSYIRVAVKSSMDNQRLIKELSGLCGR